MSRRSNRRRAFITPILVSPQAVSGYRRTEPVRPSRSQPIVVNDPTRPTLLLGSRLLSWHVATRPESLIRAVVVRMQDAYAIELVQGLERDGELPPSQRAQAVRALLDHGMGLKQLVELVPGLGSCAAASRWAALASADPFVLVCMDRGSLSFSHASALLPLPRPEQVRWAERCVARKWSHATLRRSLAERGASKPGQGAPDIAAYAAAVGQALGTKVRIDWNAATQRATVALDWHTVEALQGVMERLAAAPPAEAMLPTRARTLVLELEGMAEIDQLTAHLVASG